MKEQREKKQEKAGKELIPALYSEFGKVVCVVLWYEKNWEYVSKIVGGDFDQKPILYTKIFWSDWPIDDISFSLLYEKNILERLSFILRRATLLIWHNIKNFDIPFLRKRMIKHGIEVPDILKTYNKKPREMTIDDTMEMRKWWFSWENTSLDTICSFLWIETPKSWVDWSQVWSLYEQWKIDEIWEYCKRDVYATYQVYNRLKNSI